MSIEMGTGTTPPYLTKAELKPRTLYQSKESLSSLYFIGSDSTFLFASYTAAGTSIGPVVRSHSREFYEAPAGTFITIKNP